MKRKQWALIYLHYCIFIAILVGLIPYIPNPLPTLFSGFGAGTLGACAILYYLETKGE